MDIIAEYSSWFIIMVCLFGFLMAWGVGANDVANAMGTSVGSGALTVKQAILIAMIFEFAGAYLAGGAVTDTIRKGIIDPELFSQSPELLVYGMMSALLAAGIWLVIASIMGWPVSTTHSIVGAIVGFSAVGVGVEYVNWPKVTSIVSSWVISPVLAGVISFLIFRSVHRLILNRDDPFAAAKRWVPMYMFFVGLMMSMVTMLKGLKHIGVTASFIEAFIISVLVGLVVMVLGAAMLSRIKVKPEENLDFKIGRAHV